MLTIARSFEEDDQTSDFTPMSAEQAKAFRKNHPSLSPWRVVAFQAVCGLVVTLVFWAWTASSSVAYSAASGAVAVVVPVALFARGVTGQIASANAVSAVLSFFVWEMVKIALTVAILVAAWRWVGNLNWPALLISLVVTMKVNWIALALWAQGASGSGVKR
jgi:ATP synthase protein I